MRPDDGALVVVGATVEIDGEDETTDFVAVRLQGNLVFADRFEFGDTTNWSASIP